MTYTGFRFTGRNAVLARPADKAQATPGDTWAIDRSSAAADDGTEIDATVLNRYKANFEAAVLWLGGVLADGDAQLTNALAAKFAAYATASQVATALAAKVNVTAIGAANGVAGLDGAGKVASSQLPSYVDDVVEAANFAGLPGTGETGKIYVTLDTNLTYRWSGSAYVQISHGDVISVAGLQGAISAAALKTAIAIAVADITDASANGRSFIQATNYAAMKALLAIAAADVSGLGALATLNAVTASLISDASATGRSLITAANYATMLGLLGAQAALGYTPVNRAGDSMTGALAMGTNKITGLGDPTANQDAATKSYVDASAVASALIFG